MSDSSSATGAGEGSRERKRRRLNGDWLRARLASRSFADESELERDLAFSGRPRSSDERVRDRAERLFIMILLKAPFVSDPRCDAGGGGGGGGGGGAGTFGEVA